MALLYLLYGHLTIHSFRHDFVNLDRNMAFDYDFKVLDYTFEVKVNRSHSQMATSIVFKRTLCSTVDSFTGAHGFVT